MPQKTIPDDLPTHCWERLRDAVKNRHNPWRTPAVANAGADGPEVRTVVLRAVHRDEARLSFHTDARSDKVLQLQNQGTLSWVFYGANEDEQLRCWGRVKLHCSDTLAKQAWDQLHPSGRALYCEQAIPGTPWRPDEQILERVPGFDNFLLVHCSVSEMDWLRLAPECNVRVRMRHSDNGWTQQRLVP